MISLVFPGQGSQSVGMGKTLFDNFSSAKLIAEEANDVLGFDLTKLMFDGPIEELSKTKNTQPAIVTTSIMILKSIEELYGNIFLENISCLAGHSVGEYSALYAAGCLSFKDVLELISIRATAMENASPKNEDGSNKGAMCALIGINFQELQKIIDDYVEGNYHKCAIANDNCDGQIVITGIESDVIAVKDIALNNGAKRGIMLAVSGPFHSLWMKPAANEISKKLKEINVKSPKIPLIANYTANTISTSEEIIDLLPKQIIGTVKWRETISKIEEIGAKQIIEIGNGNVLSGIIKRSSQIPVISIQKFEDVENLKDIIN